MIYDGPALSIRVSDNCALIFHSSVRHGDRMLSAILIVDTYYIRVGSATIYYYCYTHIHTLTRTHTHCIFVYHIQHVRTTDRRSTSYELFVFKSGNTIIFSIHYTRSPTVQPIYSTIYKYICTYSYVYLYWIFLAEA